MAQMGMTLCPCDGTLDINDYLPVVERLVAAIGGDPAPLLDSLAGRVAALAREERFEEAAWARDRHRALARALERRRAWQALQQAGVIWARHSDGASALVERGRLAAAWTDEARRPLVVSTPPALPIPQVPPSVGDAEEAHLIWRWLTSGAVRLVEADGPLLLPSMPVAPLERIAV